MSRVILDVSLSLLPTILLIGMALPSYTYYPFAFITIQAIRVLFPLAFVTTVFLFGIMLCYGSPVHELQRRRKQRLSKGDA